MSAIEETGAPASAHSNGTVVEARDLTRRYGEGETAVDALRGVSLDVTAGQLVAVMGPSGSGKSTLMHILAGLDLPTTGTVSIAGTEITNLVDAKLTRLRRKHIGFVFQFFNLLPMLSAEENVVLPLSIAGEKPERDWLEELLDSTGLSDRRAHRPAELSGGQQQRVALARSLVVEPDILLLDEPLSNLDAKLRERMRTELKELQRRTGITFVYVTHDQAEALALSDHIAVMSAGRVQQFGSPFDVYAHPSNRMVADFMGLVNLVPGTVRAVANGRGTVAVADDLTFDVAAPAGLAAGDRVDVAIRPENIRLEAPGAAGGVTAKLTNHVFLGNISEYYVTFPSGPVLRVQTHPLQRMNVGDDVSVVVDALQCSAFRHDGATSA